MPSTSFTVLTPLDESLLSASRLPASVSTTTPIRPRPSSDATRNVTLFERARGVASKSTTAMIGMGERATAAASGRIWPIASRMELALHGPELPPPLLPQPEAGERYLSPP